MSRVGPCNHASRLGTTGPLHRRGICRPAKSFWNDALRDVADRVQKDCGAPFEQLGAELKVRPLRISALRHVGDGVSLDLDPHDVKEWNWFGDFESEIETRARRRFSREWHEALTVDEVEAWLRREAAAYLGELRDKERSLAAARTEAAARRRTRNRRGDRE
jgi:hypothetical protein